MCAVIIRVATLEGPPRGHGLTNDTTRLFGLEGVEVVSVEIDEDDNPMLALITAADQARYCPVPSTHRGDLRELP
jgi:hypothetical protein